MYPLFTPNMWGYTCSLLLSCYQSLGIPKRPEKQYVMPFKDCSSLISRKAGKGEVSVRPVLKGFAIFVVWKQQLQQQQQQHYIS